MNIWSSTIFTKEKIQYNYWDPERIKFLYSYILLSESLMKMTDPLGHSKVILLNPSHEWKHNVVYSLLCLINSNSNSPLIQALQEKKKFEASI
jgi:hypothetical protein